MQTLPPAAVDPWSCLLVLAGLPVVLGWLALRQARGLAVLGASGTVILLALALAHGVFSWLLAGAAAGAWGVAAVLVRLDALRQEWLVRPLWSRLRPRQGRRPPLAPGLAHPVSRAIADGFSAWWEQPLGMPLPAPPRAAWEAGARHWLKRLSRLEATPDAERRQILARLSALALAERALGALEQTPAGVWRRTEADLAVALALRDGLAVSDTVRRAGLSRAGDADDEGLDAWGALAARHADWRLHHAALAATEPAQALLAFDAALWPHLWRLAGLGVRVWWLQLIGLPTLPADAGLARRLRVLARAAAALGLVSSAGLMRYARRPGAGVALFARLWKAQALLEGAAVAASLRAQGRLDDEWQAPLAYLCDWAAAEAAQALKTATSLWSGAAGRRLLRLLTAPALRPQLASEPVTRAAARAWTPPPEDAGAGLPDSRLAARLRLARSAEAARARIVAAWRTGRLPAPGGASLTDLIEPARAAAMISAPQAVALKNALASPDQTLT